MVKVAYTVGRFQPPTIGHKALIQAVKDAADSGHAYVFVSSTMTPKAKNPLTSKQKLPLLRHMVPSGVTFVDTQDCKDKGDPCGGAIAAFYWLLEQKGYAKEDIILVVGDDRKSEFGPGADIWKRKEENDVYGPGGFKFLASAKRDPDLEVKDAANMSGTKAREYVKLGRKEDFYIAVGDSGSAADAVYAAIQGSKAKPKPKAKATPKKKRGGATTRRKVVEDAFGADAEFTYPSRRTRRSKASGRA